MPAKIQKKKMTFPQAIRAFVGYLEGTQKSHHTIKNYSLDLAAFQDFIHQEYSGKLVQPAEITPADLTRYRQFLQKRGFKTNTRRRKILTVSQFLSFLSKRNKLSPVLAKKIPAPHKMERIPFTVPSLDLLELIKKLPAVTQIEARNRVLLWTLAETGCLVSEVVDLKFEQWTLNPGMKGQVELLGKSPRLIPVSAELIQAIRSLQEFQNQSPWLFLGFNKFGSLGGPISARGVELLVKSYGSKLGHPELTPRTFRHSVIIQWFSEGLAQKDIQVRLGLRTTYAFRSYETLIPKKSANHALS
jgi:site-specific recombinase XerD